MPAELQERAGPLRLLIADDDDLFTRMLPRHLGKAVAHPALDIRAARTPEEAIELVAAEIFHVVLCDYDFRAALTGVDVLRRAGERTPRPLRILMSGHSPRALPPAGADYDAFLGKPTILRDVVPDLGAVVRERLGVPWVLRQPTG